MNTWTTVGRTLKLICIVSHMDCHILKNPIQQTIRNTLAQSASHLEQCTATQVWQVHTSPVRYNRDQLINITSQAIQNITIKIPGDPIITIRELRLSRIWRNCRGGKWLDTDFRRCRQVHNSININNLALIKLTPSVNWEMKNIVLITINVESIRNKEDRIRDELLFNECWCQYFNRDVVWKYTRRLKQDKHHSCLTHTSTD